MTDIETLFKDIQENVFDTLGKISPPNGCVDACGFWLFYCDYRMLGVPCFAYNFVGRDEDAKWAPPEWSVDIEDTFLFSMEPYYKKISEEMRGRSDEDWQQLISMQWKFYCDVCMQINNSAGKDVFPFSGWNISEDFVCGIFEERESKETYEYLVKASIGTQRVKKLGILT